jgi:hypothetical protein
MRHTTFLIILFAFLFSSCEKEIDFTGEQEASKMVLNAFVTPDSTISVHLSASRFFLSGKKTFTRINNAEVYLWRNGEQVEKLTPAQGDYNYVSSLKPNIGETIKITAAHPEYDPVESEVLIPAPTPVVEVDTTDFRHYGYTDTFKVTEDRGDGFGDYIDTQHRVMLVTKFKIKFQDPESVKNYYRLQGALLHYVYADNSEEYKLFPIKMNDIVFGNGEMGGIGTDMATSDYGEFNDILFDGKSYTITSEFQAEDNFQKEVSPNNTYDRVPVKRELIIELESLSESYYKYLSSRSLRNSSFGGGFFSEPVQIFSNIKGGIGILGGYSVSRFTIELPAWETVTEKEYHNRQEDNSDFYDYFRRDGHDY